MRTLSLFFFFLHGHQLEVSHQRNLYIPTGVVRPSVTSAFTLTLASLALPLVLQKGGLTLSVMPLPHALSQLLSVLLTLLEPESCCTCPITVPPSPPNHLFSHGHPHTYFNFWDILDEVPRGER